MTLPTNFVDDVLDDSMQGKRQYEMIENANDTVSLVDVTEYEVEGSTFGANAINQTNAQVNENTEALNGISFSFNSADQHFYASDGTHTKKLGSGEGNATASQVLNGVTFTSGQYNDVTTGTMPNRGAVSASINSTNNYTVPVGYHNGGGKVTSPLNIVNLGQITSYNVKSHYPSMDLSKISANNFFVNVTNVYVGFSDYNGNDGTVNISRNFSKSFNQSNGVFTLSITGTTQGWYKTSGNRGGKGDISESFNVYFVF